MFHGSLKIIKIQNIFTFINMHELTARIICEKLIGLDFAKFLFSHFIYNLTGVEQSECLQVLTYLAYRAVRLHQCNQNLRFRYR